MGRNRSFTIHKILITALAIAMLSIFLAACFITDAQAQAATLFCYDEKGNDRTFAANSVSTDLCYDWFGNQVGMTYGDYLQLLINSQSKKQSMTPGAPKQSGTASPTATLEPTATATLDPTTTATLDPTATATLDPTATATLDPTATATLDPTATATLDPTATAVPSATPTTDPSATAITVASATSTSQPATPTPAAKPAKPVLISPNADSTSRIQTFSWNDDANVVTYTINWSNEWSNSGSATISGTDTACNGTTCSLTATMPVEGKYTWTVTAKNGAGETVSDAMSFRIKPNITTPNGIIPSGSIGNHRWVSFVFDDVRDNVTEYNIQIYNENKNVVLDAKRAVKDLKFANNRVTFNIYVDLPNGKYYWRVRARSDNSISNWSAPIEIRTYYAPYTYITPIVNNYNTLILYSPSGVINNAALSASWRQVMGASYYTLKVFNANGAEIYAVDIPSTSCSGNTCSATPGFNFPAAGSYRVYVAAKSQTGVNWGDGSTQITYNPDSNPAAATVITPLKLNQPQQQQQTPIFPIRYLSPADNGQIYVNNAAISWIDQGETIKYYQIKITDQIGTMLLDTALDRPGAYCNNKNCTIVFETISVEDNYQIELTAIREDGTKGPATAIKFNVTQDELTLTSLYPANGLTTDDTRPYFSWSLPTNSPDAEKYTYAVRLVSLNEKKETIYSDLVCSDPRVGCFIGGASFILTENLPAGDYTWQVTNKETGLISEELRFTIR